MRRSWPTAAVAGATVAVVLAWSAHLAGGANGLLSIAPAEGPPGAAYRVTVTCDREPTLLGRTLDDDGPPGTIPPLPLDQRATDTWTYDAEAGPYDEQYHARCGDGTDPDEPTEDARFDTDAPRLFLGPVATTPFDGVPPSRIEGTDCPAGTTASVTVSVAGTAHRSSAPIDRYGDWHVALPTPVGSQPLTVDASCGDVTYARFTVAAPPTPTEPSRPAAPPTTGPATAASPNPGAPRFTG